MLIEFWALFTALIWWEYAILVILIVAFIFGDIEENFIGFAIGFGLLMFYSWSPTGSLYSHVGFFGSFFWLGVYVLFGVGWSVFKWNRLSSKKIEEARVYYNRQEKDYEDDKERLIERFGTKEEYLKAAYDNEKNINRFAYWISSWPLSVFKYFLGEMFMDLFSKLVKYLSSFYSKIGDRNVAKALAKESKENAKSSKE